ncbi:three-helix bundle dimerization domain-containing protein [Corynebacterium nasicanis]|uniref:Three-helix bundle dimerization domain-containing protein n=1 Tax=Corynebacterium nasicanis TaxID=1448267 RepID=A0ABW1QD02_9CORY
MNSTTFRSVRKDLYSRFGHRADSAIIDEILDTVIAEHTATARIADFLPVLVHREAAGRIEDHLWTHGDVGTPRPRILFASRSNAARAVLAAALARRLSDNAIVATVAGAHPENREDALIEWVMDERGLTTAKFKTERRRTLAAADVVVYLDAAEPHDLPGRSYVQWDVPATDGMGIEHIRTFADTMETRVAELLTALNIPVRSGAVAEELAA